MVGRIRPGRPHPTGDLRLSRNKEHRVNVSSLYLLSFIFYRSPIKSPISGAQTNQEKKKKGARVRLSKISPILLKERLQVGLSLHDRTPDSEGETPIETRSTAAFLLTRLNYSPHSPGRSEPARRLRQREAGFHAAAVVGAFPAVTVYIPQQAARRLRRRGANRPVNDATGCAG